MKAPALLATLVLGLLLAPLCSEAQPPTKVYRIGWLGAGPPLPEPNPSLEAFRQGLRDLGYVEGQSILLEVRWSEGHLDRLAELAADLVRRQVDVLVAYV